MYCRLLSLDIACPGCGSLYKLGPGRGGASNWNHLTQRFHCKCGVNLALGVIAYPPPLGRATPAWDQIPTARERQELRNQVDSVWCEEQRGERANLLSAVYKSVEPSLPESGKAGLKR